MNEIRRLVLRAIAGINGVEVTFGLREAAILSILGIGIAVAAAYHYAS
jgi:uncharacterized protein YaaW (UPF0174 family)